MRAGGACWAGIGEFGAHGSWRESEGGGGGVGREREKRRGGVGEVRGVKRAYFQYRLVCEELSRAPASLFFGS
jgi:hypothetical protein